MSLVCSLTECSGCIARLPCIQRALNGCAGAARSCAPLIHLRAATGPSGRFTQSSCSATIGLSGSVGLGGSGGVDDVLEDGVQVHARERDA
jgi:hypothetical protein